jgi:hypothetical protein
MTGAQGRAGEQIQGSCLCGAVMFEIHGPFPAMYQCHCSLCRKQGGSASNTGLIVAADKFHWTAGEPLVTQWQKPSGFRSHFCSRCGSPVPNPLRDTGFIWVPSGLLDNGEALEIAAQLYVGSRASWDQAKGGGKEFETAPGLAALIAWLHAPE